MDIPKPLDLQVRNLQRSKKVNTKLLRGMGDFILEHLGVLQAEVGILLVNATKMASINETFLAHEGSTDVITFSHLPKTDRERLYGEIYISIPDAEEYSREYGTTWQAEVVRYMVHGLLHLQGYDDLNSGDRKIMKRRENAMVRKIELEFNLKKVAG